MNDLLFEQKRTQALAVRCSYCNADTGEQCVGTLSQIPIQHQPAHSVRIKNAALLASARRPSAAIKRQTVTSPSRTYGTRGWFIAENSGRCGTCWKPYNRGTSVIAISARNLRAECCAALMEEAKER
ncbi:MAG: hypothetical protein JO296_21290 [Pseudonocardiales bacterium]|nr:hypothetical protein [Pseudonocardiales bacterium]